MDPHAESAWVRLDVRGPGRPTRSPRWRSRDDPTHSDSDGVLEVGSPQISLVDLLDRLLGTGVVLAGDVTISLTGVDLVQVRLRALISSVRADMVEGSR